jgi:VWFA-related protein
MTWFVALVLVLCLPGGPIAVLAQGDAQQRSGPTIKTDVRQVLVPVIVTDKYGKYIADLSAGDFSVYEDDVQQKIVAFSRAPVSVTNAGGEAAATRGQTTNGHYAGFATSPVNTYLICIDTLHSRFENFARVRKSLREFFSHEEPGDSQYALVAIGRKLHVLVDSTRDPATILNALAGKELLKTILDSEAANLAHATQEFAELVGIGVAAAIATRKKLIWQTLGVPAIKGKFARLCSVFPNVLQFSMTIL